MGQVKEAPERLCKEEQNNQSGGILCSAPNHAAVTRASDRRYTHSRAPLCQKWVLQADAGECGTSRLFLLKLPFCILSMLDCFSLLCAFYSLLHDLHIDHCTLISLTFADLHSELFRVFPECVQGRPQAEAEQCAAVVLESFWPLHGRCVHLSSQLARCTGVHLTLRVGKPARVDESRQSEFKWQGRKR